MVCDKEKCTGCFACYNICPKNAITMIEDEYGFVKPYIDKNKCVNCNLCKKGCPVNNRVEYRYPSNCFAMYAKDEKIRSTSTSGGAATVFSQYIIEEKNGAVYGASFDTNMKLKHQRVTTIENLKKIQGSKYVQSYIEDCMKKIKEDLKANLTVLFIGTPCQIAGLKNFLQKEYENLYTIDLICHGVPSQKFLKDEIDNLKINKKYNNILFRGQDGFKLKLVNNEKIIQAIKMEDSKYFNGFMKALFYRESCYNCLYARPERVSDITIGDFWGLSPESSMYANREDGVSVILPCTDKGLELINQAKDKMIVEERLVEEAIRGNSQLSQPSKKHYRVDKFRKYYFKMGFQAAYNKTMRYEIMKKQIKKNKFIYSIYNKMKGKK